MPLSWTYAFLRWFHGPSQAVMAPTDRGQDATWRPEGFENVVLWSRGVDLDIFKPQPRQSPEHRAADLPVRRPRRGREEHRGVPRARPAGLQVGRGRGPALARLRARYPEVNYLGVLNQCELAQVYASADVFVFPSKTDTFGLVLLEAMACGLPVAAYPVTGPLDVIGRTPRAA